MPAAPLRILAIQSWVIPIDGIRAALAAAGFAPRITRADFEAAVDAALWRGGIDLILWAPNTPNLSRSFLEARARVHGISAPILELGDLARLPIEVGQALAARLN